MDMMVLVVDITKGLQAQTVECVVIGEAVIASGAEAIIVLNKVSSIRHSRMLHTAGRSGGTLVLRGYRDMIGFGESIVDPLLICVCQR